MGKTHSIHQKQENEHGLPRSIIAMDTGSVHVFCAFAWMGVTLVEKRKASIAAGAGCHVAGQPVDHFGGQRGSEGLCDPGGLESAPSAPGRIMASVLGRTAQRVRESGAARVGSDRAG